MIPPVVRAYTDSVAGLSHTSPRATKTGDLVVLITWERAGAGVPTFTLQGSWTELFNQPHDDGSTDGRLAAACIVAGSDGANSYQAYTSSVGTTTLTHMIVFKAGTFHTTLSNHTAIGGNSTNNQPPDSPELTGLTSTDAYAVLTTAAWHFGSNLNPVVTPPAGWALMSHFQGSVNSELATGIRRYDPLGATSIDPGAWTDNAVPNGTAALTIAIRGTSTPTDPQIDNSCNYLDIAAAGTTGTVVNAGASAGVVAAYVLIAQNTSTTDQVTGVTYGGSAMTRQGFITDAAGEPGGVYVYKLESSVPQGTQDAVVSISSPAGAKRVRVVTVYHSAAVSVIDDDTIDTDTADPSSTLATNAGFKGVVISMLHSGHNAPTDIDAGTGVWLVDGGRDFGNQSEATVVGEKTGANVTVGFTQTSEDAAMYSLAVGVQVTEHTLGAIDLTGTGAFSASALTIEKILGAVALAGSGDFTVNELTIEGFVEHFISADFTGAGALSVTLLQELFLPDIDLTGSAAWEADLIAEFPISANLTGAAAWEALGLQVELFTSASFDGNAAWTAPLSMETFLNAISLSGNAEFAVAELIIGSIQEHFIQADFVGEGSFTAQLGVRAQAAPVAFLTSPLYRVIEENIGDAMPVNAKRVEIRSKPDGTASRRIRLDGSWLLAIKIDHVDTEAGCDVQVRDSSRTILTITDANTDSYLPVREEIVDSTGVGLGMYEPAVITGSQLFIDVTGAGASKSVFITVYYQ